MNGIRGFIITQLSAVRYASDIDQDVFTIAWKGKLIQWGTMYQEGVAVDRGYYNDYRLIVWGRYWRLQFKTSEAVEYVSDTANATDYPEGWIIAIYYGNGRVDLYHDTTLIASGSVTYYDLVHGTSAAKIYPYFGGAWGGVSYCKGVGFWNRVLDSNEIQDLVNGKIPVNPIYYFDFSKDQFNPIDYGTGSHSVLVGSWLVNQSERTNAKSTIANSVRTQTSLRTLKVTEL